MRIFIGVLMGIVIFVIGRRMVMAIASSRPKEEREEGPEDVADLDVVFLCEECGTEYRVERLGELQVPRHCGEPMHVVQRPRGAG